MSRKIKSYGLLWVVFVAVAAVTGPAQPLPADRAAAACDQPAFALRVLSYNIQRGLGDAGFHRIAALIRRHRPDLVCLQEVAWPKKPNLDWVRNQVEVLAGELGYQWACAERGRLRYETYGMAVLVRGEILSARDLRVPGELPHALWTELRIDGQRIDVASVHSRSVAPGLRSVGYLATEWARTRQAKQLARQTAGSRCPVVVAGDFNTIATAPSYAVLTAGLVDAAAGHPGQEDYTRLTQGLPLRIDYVFLSPIWAVCDYQVLPVDLSDHRPLLTTICLPQESATPPPT